MVSALLKSAFSLSIILCNTLAAGCVSTAYVAYNLNPKWTVYELFNLFILSAIFLEYPIFT